MKLLAPDILELTRELTPYVSGAGFVLGFFLWLLGGSSHRFWLALVVTLTAGVIGLNYGPDEIQPLVAGLLLALAAGTLALSLVRILLFAAGGVAALALVHALNTGWNGFVVFLCGGMAGVFLYRTWVMVLSSFSGSLLMAYAVFSILERTGKLSSTDFATRHAPLLNWGIAGLTALGILTQFLIERRRNRGAKVGSGKGKGKGEKAKAEGPQGPPPLPSAESPWWKKLPIPQITWRQAG